MKQEGKEYSDLLKSVKENVRPGTEASKAIKTMRKTKDGDMMILLSGEGKENKGLLKEEIAKVQGVKLVDRSRDSRRTLFINDIDGITSKEEVKKAIREAGNAHADQILFGDLREFHGGTQAITVRAIRDTADLLIAKGKVQIGLSWCPVKERVDVMRCFRCWQYGHIGKDCHDASDHLAGECDRCLTCKAAGHTAGGARCPEFRKAVARERLRRRKKKAY